MDEEEKYTPKTDGKYTIGFCYSCNREAVAARSGEVYNCPVCGDPHPNKRVEKFGVSDAAGEILVKADKAYIDRDYQTARELYMSALAVDGNEPYAHLGAALAEFEVVFDSYGEPTARKNTNEKFEQCLHFKRAIELTEKSPRSDRYAELGAKIDGLMSTLDFKALQKKGFEYVGSQLDRYSGDKPDVKIENGTTRINGLAFYLSDTVRSVHIPASVTEIDASAFSANLERITVDPKNKNYAAIDGCLIDKRNKRLVFACMDSTIPAGGAVEIICRRAYDMQKSRESIIIPEGVTTIERSAFDCCSAMTKATIPSTVTKIEECAFVNCYKLADITVAPDNAEYYVENGCLIERSSGTLIFGCIGCEIPNTVKRIGSCAFGGDHKALHFPAGVESGIEESFCGCETIERLTVDPQNAKYRSDGNCIIDRASGTLIMGCSQSVIPSDGSVKTIGSNAFRDCKNLVKLTVPSSVTEIKDFAFACCSSLTEIELPDTIELIDSYAFEMCYALKAFRVPSGVKTLGMFVFEACTDLESLYIPSSVTKIYDCIISGCSKLKTVEFEDKTGWFGNDAPLSPEELEGDEAKDLLDSFITLEKK